MIDVEFEARGVRGCGVLSSAPGWRAPIDEWIEVAGAE